MIIFILNLLKKIKKMQKFFRNVHPPVPLGRWCFCGDKNKKGIDVLQWKEIQKQKRLEMVEKKQDPFHLCPKSETFYEKQREEYMIPFVFEI